MAQQQYAGPMNDKTQRVVAEDSLASTLARMNSQADRLADLIGKLDNICDAVQPEPAKQQPTGSIPPKPEYPPYLVGSAGHIEARLNSLLKDMDERVQRLENALGA